MRRLFQHLHSPSKRALAALHTYSIPCYTATKQCQQRSQHESRVLGTGKTLNPRPQYNSFCTSRAKSLDQYELPSVTWGVIRGRKDRLVAKVIICDYLKSIGVATEDLEEIELPSTVEVMKERVEFLQNLGLTIEDINQYPLMLGCSIRKNIAPVLEFLYKMGFFKPDMLNMIKKYPQILHASVIVDLAPIIHFFKGIDLHRRNAPNVLLKYPHLLHLRREGTVATSLGYLVSIGVNPRDIAPMVLDYPQFLGMQVRKTIKPIVDYLVSIGIPKMIVARMIEKRPYILGFELEESMKHNVELLQTYGVRKSRIAFVIAQYPPLLGMYLKPKLASQQYFFHFNLRISPEDFATVLEKMPQVVTLPHTVIKLRTMFLVEKGFSPEDLAKMIVKCPQLIVVNIELMKRSFYFFKADMEKPLSDLVEFPEYFTYSLEFRIRPRYQKLVEKGVEGSLEWMLNCSNERFAERLASEFIENETGCPSFSMGGVLPMPHDDLVGGGDSGEDDDEESDDEVFFRRTITV